jgi:hypothetical protein
MATATTGVATASAATHPLRDSALQHNKKGVKKTNKIFIEQFSYFLQTHKNVFYIGNRKKRNILFVFDGTIFEFLSCKTRHNFFIPQTSGQILRKRRHCKTGVLYFLRTSCAQGL